MNPADIRRVVDDVLAEQKRKMPEADLVVLSTIAAILTSFGIEEEDRKQLKEDFSYLRRLRLSTEAVTSFSLKAAVTVLVSAVIGAIWMGLKVALGK